MRQVIDFGRNSPDGAQSVGAAWGANPATGAKEGRLEWRLKRPFLLCAG